MGSDTYESPLASRNSSPEMLRLFSPQHKFSLWRKLWVELARAERELGINRITPEALAQMERAVDQIDFKKAAEWEKRLRHDVMAHVHTFEEAAPAAKGIIHLGATSQFVVDNADLIIMRDGMKLLCARLANAIDGLGTFAAKWKDLPTLAYTHFQPAQLTTVGKRATLWAQDLVLDLEELEYRISTLKFRGVKGTTGTQASFLTLFDGDHGKCDHLDQMVTERFGFRESYNVTGQTYPRKVDAQIVSSLASMAASVHKFANDIRLLAGMKQVEEPFEEEQVGSSAMAYKRNPMRCERATGLARFVISLASSPLQTAAEQWFERTLDDSSNKRLSIPESFLAIDGALLLVINVARGLVVYPSTIAAAVMAELPFMATEEILMAGVRAGGDRQQLHELIRHHSQAAAEQVKSHGRPNDLIHRLQQDPAFEKLNINQLLDPAHFIGRAPQQTEHFIISVVEPIRQRYRAQLGQNITLSV
ncbi:MAG TPA: adenylosuccinate lyase [Tepidisphaeraceae bacterium]|jgi:adenylosuccinate lyase|nr:adenylosuccinate lyase [Tepidisphaeraceae bacterium]HEV8606055.1 adenylosuccinate lyase [Tepidisphaeraceae bacterium]